MLRKSLVTFLTVAALCLANATVARGATISIVTSDSGTYDQTGFHDPTNQNYVAGRWEDPFSGFAYHWTDFFTFDLSSVMGDTILSATLQLYSAEISSNGTFKAFDVTTPEPILTRGTGGVLAHIDLGSGINFGQIALTTGDSFTIIQITLNAAAVAAIQAGANLGSMFAIGGDYLGDGSTDDYVFGFSDFNSNNQLILETTAAVPDGGITISLLGGALMALGVLRRKYNR